MAIENLELDKDNLAHDSYLSLIANVLESYNEDLKKADLELDNKSKILSQINESYSMYHAIKNSTLDTTLSNSDILVQELNDKLLSIEIQFNEKSTSIDTQFQEKETEINETFNNLGSTIDQTFEQKETEINETFNNLGSTIEQTFEQKESEITQTFEQKSTSIDTQFQEKETAITQTFDNKLESINTTFDNKETEITQTINAKITALDKKVTDGDFNGTDGKNGKDGLPGTTDYNDLDNKPKMSFVPLLVLSIRTSEELDSVKKNGMYRVDPCSSLPSSHHYSLICFGNCNNVVSHLITHYITGKSYVRSFSTKWSSWFSIN